MRQIQILSPIVVEGYHLQGYDIQFLVFQSGEDSTKESASHGIGFDKNQCVLYQGLKH
jgi:hypothetical protein